MKKTVLFLLFSCSLLSADENTLRVYHIGNSLTMSLTLDRVHSLFEQAGVDYQFGSQLSGGKSLIRHMNYQEEPKQKWTVWETNQKSGENWEPDPNHHYGKKELRFGRYEEALSAHRWDKVVMQIYGSPLKDDVEAIRHFTGICLKNNTCNQFYIYSPWPRREKEKQADGSIRVKDLDYAKAWTLPYAYEVDSTEKQAAWNTASRAYTDKLYAEMKKRLPENSGLYLVPAGEVLFELDRKIKAGEIPGIPELAARDPARVAGWQEGGDLSRGINLIYADPVHLNPMPHKAGTLGIFISGTTMYTVLSGNSPVGLSAAAYGLDDEKDAALIRAVQRVIWDTVTRDPRTGVAK